MIRALLLAALLGSTASAAMGQDSHVWSDRPSDGLLERPELQALVDLQVLRDGAGLAAALDHDDPAVRARAAFALAAVQDPAAVPALLAALNDPAPAVRADAAFAVGLTADSTASEALLAALGDETDPAASARLLEALGRIGDEAALARLAEIQAGDGEGAAFARAFAGFGLRGVHHPHSTERLALFLDDDDPAVREAAAYPFGRWSEPQTWSTHADRVRAALDAAYPFQYGPPTDVAPEGPAPSIHLLAALGRLADSTDTGRIVRWLEDGVDWRARVAAARALAGRTAELPARTALLAALDDPSVHVAVAAAGALSEADSLPPDAVRELAVLATMQPGRWQTVVAALPAVAKDGAEALAIMFLMNLDLRDPGNHFARAGALRAMGHGETRGGFRVLEDEVGWESPLVSSAAIEGLANRWRRGATDVAPPERWYAAFVEGVERGDRATVSEAAPLLADSTFVAMGSVDVLLGAWRNLAAPADVEAMTAVLGALGSTGSPDARTPLEEALAHPEPSIRRAAAEALAELTGAPVETPPGADPPDRTIDWDGLAALGPRPRLVLETSRGRVVIEMDAEQAPQTTWTVAGFARDGLYDGVPFHRVVPNFVIQGGDFERGDGWGGPGFEIRTEPTRIDYERGTAGMASAGRDTEGAQWFVTHSIQPHLNGRYTAFGRVVEGLDVVDRVLQGDVVTSARVIGAGPTP